MMKRDYGQYFTKNSIWLKPQIKDFIINTKADIVLDPFCGGGDLLKVAEELGFKKCIGYDIDPQLKWNVRDSLKEIDKINGLILTNPPYLAKNSAKRTKSKSYDYFKDNNYTDLYQIALDRILESSENSVVIIPESFIQTGLFFERLHSITVIEENPFEDTECPICVACFDGILKGSDDVSVYKNDKYVFSLGYLERQRKYPKMNIPVSFNDKNGNIGIRCIDGVSKGDKICFSYPDKLNYNLDKIGVSSCSITVADVETAKPIDRIIDVSNNILNKYREDTKDLLLCPFKGNQKDNTRRRRLDFQTARAILEEAIEVA